MKNDVSSMCLKRNYLNLKMYGHEHESKIHAQRWFGFISRRIANDLRDSKL